MKKKKILVVDNHPVMLKLMDKLLGGEGHEVLTAQDGLSALNILKTSVPDTVFVDLVMPNISGDKLCRIIRGMSKLKDTHIVILSAIAAEQDIDLDDLGADACIAKGSFDNMKRHVLAVLDQLDQSISHDQSRQIMGLEDIYQREITKELLASKKHFEVILDYMCEGILELNRQGEILYSNAAAISFIGIPEEKLLGSGFTELFHETHRQRIEDLLEATSNVPQEISDTSPARLNGNYVALSFLPIKDEWNETIIVIVHDVSERKRAKEALQASEQRFKSLSQNAPDIIYTLDLNGCFTYVNPAWERIMGHGVEEVTGKSFTDFARQEDVKGYLRYFKRIKAGKEMTEDITGPLIHKDGSTRLFSISGAPNLEEGRTMGLVGLLKDITEQQRLQNQLQQAEKMEAIGTVAGGVAHDLNNILAGVVSYPELLLMQISQDSPLRKPMLTIQKSGEKAAAIVQDLLTLTRRRAAVTEVVNLRDIISDYLESPEHQKLQSYHDTIQVETNIESNLLNILASPVHLSKTVMNLVSNAAEAMAEGGEIFISAENRYVDRPIRGYDDIQEGDYVALTVSDTGIGISSEDIKKVFEPFYTKKNMGRSGTGLGMAVVWATMKDHNGYIDVQSSEGKGSTFTLYFPVTRRESDKHRSLLSVEDYAGRGELVLVVDDVEEQREIASESLVILGYCVTSVSSGEQAVEYMKTNSADLLVLDMIMDPGIDGLETYKRILEYCPGQKAVIATGFSETKRVKKVQELGAGAYIKKPYLLEKIGLAVRAELDK